jgi:hypothetical protein
MVEIVGCDEIAGAPAYHCSEYISEHGTIWHLLLRQKCVLLVTQGPVTGAT